MKFFRRLKSLRRRLTRNVLKRRLVLEQFEERRVLATFVVDSLSDATNAGDGLTSLREAMALANANADADTISFASSLVAGGPATITLSTVGDTTLGASAFAISTPITIQGPTGNNGVTIEGDGSNLRFAFVATTGDLTLHSLTIANFKNVGENGGVGGGGGGGGFGGALLNDGSLQLVNSLVTGSTALGGDGGAAGVSGAGGTGGNGYDSNTRTVPLAPGRAGGNGSTGGIGGGGVAGGTAGLGAAINTNRTQPGGTGGAGGNGANGAFGGGGGGGGSGGGGGGGHGSNVRFGAGFSIRYNATNGGSGGAGGFGGNGGFGGGGGGGGSAGTGGTGGSARSPYQSGFGGNGGNVGNVGFGGFGAGNGSRALVSYPGGFGVQGSEIPVLGRPGGSGSASGTGGGGAGMGGAIFNRAGSLTITNSTITGNTAQGGVSPFVGAPFEIPYYAVPGGAGFGGGVFSLNGNVTLTNSTVSGNTVAGGATVVDYNGYTYIGPRGAAAGGAVYSLGMDSTGFGSAAGAQVNAVNTLFANTTGGSDLVNNNATFYGSHNLATQSSGLPISVTVTTSAALNLGALTNNGGPTRTIALGGTSSARNAGLDTTQAPHDLTTDQRGANRLFASGVDIGAFEPAPFASTNLATLDLGTTDVGTPSSPAQTFQVSGVDLTDDVFVTGVPGIELSFNGTTFSSSLTIPASALSGGVLSPTTIHTRISATATAGSLSDANIAIDTLGASTWYVSVSGTAVATGETPSFVVTTASDIVNNTDGLTSLREAIAHANTTAGADTITFGDGSALVGGTNFTDAAADTILLSLGQMDITESLTITGLSAAHTIVDGNEASRIFSITSGDTTLENLTLTRGKVTTYLVDGGAIHSTSTGTLTVTNSTLSGNSTTGIAGRGGAIYSYSGAVTVNNSTLTGNSTTGNNSPGGAISASTGAVTVTNSTVSGNSTTGDNSRGGAIFAGTGTVTLSNSTVSGNSTTGNNSHGGAILAFDGTVTLSNSTLTGNQAALGVGGGIAQNSGYYSSNAPFTITNSIIAQNTDNGTAADILKSPTATLTITHSLIGDNTGFATEFPATAGSTPDANGNFIGSGAAPLDPLLGPLQDNGGPTFTHALLAGSLAINTGSNANVPADALDLDGDEDTTEPVPFDQRGLGFTRIIGVVDIGAFEIQNVAPTAVAFVNASTSLTENTNTTPRIKLADIAVTDDGVGTNGLSISGVDAAFFELDGDDLFLKPGTVLDFEAKSSYSVRVNVDDTSVGSSPDAFADFVLTVNNILELNGIDVQNGQTQRSFVRNVDLLFSQGESGLQNLITGNRIKLTRSDLNGNNGIVLTPPTPSVAGDRIVFDFGAQGIGGNRNTNAGDGYYEIAMDLDGNGSFETKKYFHRLFGDVTGDGLVDSRDKARVLAGVGTTSVEADVNGDGVVNALDVSYVTRAIGKKLKGDLHRDD